LPGWPSVAESSIIARDVLLAEATGSRLHICHLSTAESVDIVRWAKARAIQVTAEVTPHHLLLTEDLVANYNPFYKVNPPLRSQSDVLALRAAVADGTIDIVATDHAPHPEETKDCEWGAAAFGMLGLETAASIVYTTLVKTGLIDWKRFQEIMSWKPAEISGMTNQGQESKSGSAANIVLFDPNCELEVSAQGESKSSNNPYAGMKMIGKVVHTIYNGKLTVTNGEVVDLKGSNA
jgi:dihydroorotase